MKFDNQIDLNLLRLFVTLVESSSLSAAAMRTGMTRSNLSHRLKALERSLNAQLLNRSPRDMKMTEAGELLYHHAVRMLDEVEVAKTSIHQLNHSIQGKVRIRLPTGLGHLYLTSLLLEFSAQYPQVALRVTFNDNLGDLITEEIDVALKITSAPPIDHVARKVCDIDWCLSATPKYLEKFSPLTSVESLEQLDLIAPTAMGTRINLRLQRDQQQVTTLSFTPRIQSGNYPFLVQAALSGLGAAVLPRYTVWSHLQNKQLQEVMPDHKPEGMGDSIFIITPSNRFPKAATKLLIEHLQQYIRQQASQWNHTLLVDS